VLGVFHYIIHPRSSVQPHNRLSRRAYSGLKETPRKAFKCLLVGMLLLGSASLLGAEQGITLSTFSPLARHSTDGLTPESLLSEAIKNYQGLTSYQCRLILHVTKGKEEQNSEYIFYYQKPNLVRMYVDEGVGKGNTVLLRKDGLIRGRREGAFSFFPITLKPDDQRLCDLWNRQFSQTDWGKILEETMARLRTYHSSTLEVVNGGKQFLLTLKGNDGFVEQTWLDHDQLILAQKHVVSQSGDRLDVRWTEVSLNPHFDDSFFYF
jgi:outer membrane lipoprotein-sorting protein